MFRTWNRKIGLFVVAIIAVSTLADAQQSVWTVNNENRANIATDKAVARQTFPKEFKLFNLNIEPLRQQLFSIVDNSARQQSTVISLPNADGNIEQFEVYEASNFEPDLQAQFPEIRAFSGKGVTDRYATLKLSISPQGIKTMVFRTDTDNEFIEPYSQDRTVYAVFRSHREKGKLPWACSTEERELASGIDSQLPTNLPLSSTGQLKTIRLAQSCNGEYSNYFGATSSAQVDLVLAAFNATLTRTNGVYEKDLALHLNLIANTTAVIYYNPATDPYTSLGQWNGQLQSTLTANIGEANYDIGHMFGASGGGGNAGCIGCVCTDGTKGRGITSPADAIPEGDNFDIDYVIHEVGHQLGANHSFSFQNEGSGVNKEVGSGITIMGYAGITSQDVAPHSIDIFHQANIQQIQTNLAPKTCPVTTVMTANHPPVVSPVSNYTIPISTPFALTGSATDPEGDPLTYNWEQNDNTTTTGSNSVASPTKATGPNWLSFPSTASRTRTFPRLSTLQGGLLVTPTLPGGDAIANIEALSSVSRTLNFRLTVRDNHPYVAGSTTGQTQFTDMTVTVSNTSGPFALTVPNTGVSWVGNSAQTVTWNVAGTTGAPVSAANVKISLSTDSGATFPTTILASTPNDGTESITVPNMPTGTARIKVEAVGNIFFDISNANFTITPGAFALQRAPLDFDGDNKTDYGVVRTNAGSLDWYLQQSLSGFSGTNWGVAGDQLVPGDYDGDLKWDLAVWRSGIFHILRSSTGTLQSVSFGQAGDDPLITQDFDGDGKTDPAVARNESGNIAWYLLRSTAGFTGVTFGIHATDRRIRGDFDGDGKADIAIYRHTTGAFYVLRSSDGGLQAASFGTPATDFVVPADFDGDGKTDYALWRGNGVGTPGDWYWLRSLDGGFGQLQFGVGNQDLPATGDFDGDGKTDQAVFRPGASAAFYANRSTLGPTGIAFGTTGDVPLGYSLQAR